MTQEEKNEQKRLKTIGSRVTEIQYDFIKHHAASESRSQSEFVIKCMATHTNLKNHKALLIDAIRNYLKDPLTFLDYKKRSQMENSLKFLKEFDCKKM